MDTGRMGVEGRGGDVLGKIALTNRPVDSFVDILLRTLVIKQS